MAKIYKPIKHLHEKRRIASITTYVTIGLILALFGYWNITRESGFSIVVLAFQTLPLLLILPGIIKGYYRAYSWLCFILLMYFIVAVERSMLSTAQYLDYVFVGLIVILFCSSMMAGRWLQREQKPWAVTQSTAANQHEDA